MNWGHLRCVSQFSFGAPLCLVECIKLGVVTLDLWLRDVEASTAKHILIGLEIEHTALWRVCQAGHDIDHASKLIGYTFLNSWGNHANLVATALSQVTANIFVRDEHHVHGQSSQLLVGVKEIVTHKIPCLEAVVRLMRDAHLAVGPETAVLIGVLYQVHDYSLIVMAATGQVRNSISEDRPRILNLNLALILGAD